MGTEFDPIAWAKGLAISASRIRLAPGVIGKSSLLNAGVLILWGIVLWKINGENPMFDALRFAGAIAATLYVRQENRSMQDFAVKNPVLALMEGADITEHKKVELEAAAKGLPGGGTATLSSDPLKLPPSSMSDDGQ